MITDAERHRLHLALEGSIGEEANTLMELLPATGWADVATRHDLEHGLALLRAEIHTDMADLRADLHREIRELHRSLFFGMLTALSAQTALLITFISQLR